MNRSLAWLLPLLLVPAISTSAQKRAFTIEDLYRIKAISDIHVSPDGKSVVYAVGSSDLARATRQSHLWMMNIDGSQTRQMTRGDKSEYSPVVSPDGHWIAFISDRDGEPNLFVIPVNGGEARKVTGISTGVSDPVWSPDGQYIAFSTDGYPECGNDDACNKRISETWRDGPLKAHMADHLFFRHWNEWKDGTRTHIFLAEVATGKTRDLTPGDFDSPTFQLGGPLQYDFSPDGKEFVYVSNHDKNPAESTNNDLWLINLQDSTPRPKNITSANRSYDGSPKYSPDGRYIAYRMQKQPAYESDLFRLAIYDRASGASAILTDSFNNWVDDYDWTADSKSIYFTAPVEGQNPIFNVDIASKTIKQVLAYKTIDGFEFTRDGRRLVFIRRSVGDPSEVYSAAISDGKAGDITRLTNINTGVAAEVDIRPAESMWVEGAEGAKIQVFIVKPHDFDPGKRYPLVFNVHGGPQDQWADAFRGDWQVYPGAGYVVAFCNPHGSTGYGQDFTAEISGDYGGMVFEDLMKVSDALAKLPYVDTNRMGAMGWSFGGYMMDWFEGHTDRFKAIASMMGIFDLRSFYGETEELWFPQWDLKGQPWDSPLYEKWSPSNSVKNFKTPCLVITGERDYRIPYTQSVQFYTALQKMNVPSRLIVYSNAGHWPSWYEMALYYTAHLDWFHKYLGGDPPPWTTEQFLRNQIFDRATGKRVTPDQASAPSAGNR
jgi:dipeptidyl aminopeptidase/acylaminoacyl peptidase